MHRLRDLDQDLEDEFVDEFGDSAEEWNEDNSDEVHKQIFSPTTKKE